MHCHCEDWKDNCFCQLKKPRVFWCIRIAEWKMSPPPPRFKMLRRLCNKRTNWPILQVIAWVWLIILYEVLHKLHTIKICFGKITSITDETSVKMSQKLTLNQRMFWILGGNKWAKFQTKAQKSSDINVDQEIWWHIWETRRSVLYLGDSLIIREIFRTCKLQVMHNFGNWMHIMMVQFLFRFLFWSALVHSNMWSSTVWTCNTGISCSFVQCFGWVYVKLNPVTLSLLSYLLQ